MSTTIKWRAEFESIEVNRLHAEVFKTRAERDWMAMVGEHSLGWVTARDDDQLVGFVNVIWDGMVHAWLQDAMVRSESRHHEIGTKLISTARDESKQAGCQWLHVDFEEGLSAFYFQACGFVPTKAGLLQLQ
jgi:GNAT superfamily N-acetyltransferase